MAKRLLQQILQHAALACFAKACQASLAAMKISLKEQFCRPTVPLLKGTHDRLSLVSIPPMHSLCKWTDGPDV